MQRGSAQIVLLFFGIIIILAGFYLYSNKSSVSPNLTNPLAQVVKNPTYKNENLGFEFEYPNGLMAKEDSEEDFNQRSAGATGKNVNNFRKNFKGYIFYEPGKFLGAAVVLGKDNSYETNPFTVWVFDNPQDLNIDAWYKNYWYFPFVWGDFTYKGKTELAPKDEATVSGQMAKSGVIDYQPGKPKFVYIGKDKKMYLFRIIGSDGNKILETFKFL